MKREVPDNGPFVDLRGLFVLTAVIILAFGLRDFFFLMHGLSVEKSPGHAVKLVPVETLADARIFLIGGKADINMATLSELVMVPGIGEKSAEKILAYRHDVGFVLDMDELLAPSGPLGPRTLSGLKRYFRAGPY